MRESLPRLCVAVLGLFTGGWLIIQAIARRRMRAAGATAGIPVVPAWVPPPPRTPAPESVPGPLPAQGTRRVPEQRPRPGADPLAGDSDLYAVANGEDAWW